MIKFGTDGWRAVMAEEFTFANVELVAQAIAQYVLEEGKGLGVVVGYDNRFLSRRFAQRVGEVLAGNNIPVYMTSEVCPTPATAYAILTQKSAGAVMLTASHNPPEYNGIKFIPHYAGPALPDITDKIEALLEKVLAHGKVEKLTKEKALAYNLWQEIDPKKAYLKHLRGLVDLELIGQAGLKVVLDPMYGAGIGYLEELLAGICSYSAIRNYRDPLFGGSLPEPTETNLKELSQEVLRTGSSLGLALDGDGDRFGIIDADGSYLSPNEILTLCYYHLLKNKGVRGPVARTLATTHLLDRLAQSFDQRVEETPVGFKYIGKMLRERGCILGGEESGGLSIAGHIPEKDGILAAALVLELRAMSGKPLKETLREIEKRWGKVYNERLDVRTTAEAKERILSQLETYFPSKFAGLPVVERLAVDGVKFTLAHGSWVLIRPSGTEPVFRIYVEANTPEALRQIQKEVLTELEISDLTFS